MMTPKKDDSFSQIQQLLAYKRYDRPSSDYFDGVLGEFHRRQRSALLQPKSLPGSWWADFVETLTFQPSRVLRYGMAMACVLVFAVIGLTEGGWSHQASVAAGKQDQSKTVYAFSDTTAGHSSRGVDQQIDAMSVSAVNYSQNEGKAHYVLNDRPAAYETSLAF